MPMTLGDITGRRGWAQGFMERVPFVGLRETREGQLAQSEKLISDLGAAYGGPQADAVQASILAKSKSVRSAVGKLEDRVAQQADAFGSIPVPNALQTLEESIKSLQAKKIVPEAAINKLESIQKSLSSGNTFSSLKDLKTDIREIVDSAYSDSPHAIVGPRSVRPFVGFNQALDTDMRNFLSENNPKLLRDWKVADDLWSTRVVDIYKNPTVAGLTKQTDPTALYKSVNAAVGSKPYTMYQALDADGRSAYRNMFVQDAIEKAMGPNTNQVSPARFATYIEKHQEQLGLFFKGQDAAQLEGIGRLMRHAERAGTVNANPVNGSLILPLTAGGASFWAMTAHPAVTAGAYAAAFSVKKLMTSQAGQRFLLAASKQSPGSAAMNALIRVHATTLAATENDDENAAR